MGQQPSEINNQIWFMPWAGLKDEVQIGNVWFSPWGRLREQIGVDVAREYLDSYFNSYTDWEGQPVDTVAVCSCGVCPLRILSESEFNHMRQACDALIFSSIAPSVVNAVCSGNYSMGPPSSDRYQLIGQNFRLGETGIAVRAGSNLIAGYQMGELRFTRPFTVGGPFASSDADLIRGLDRLLRSDSDLSLQDRVYRSFEWFRLAHTDSEHTSVLSKVVMMATAVEILLGVPKTGKKKEWIASCLDKMCGTSDMAFEERTDRKGTKYHHTALAWWAYDFYDLRNSVVHGDAVDLERLRYECGAPRTWLTQLVVADVVVWECVLRGLFTGELFGEDVRELAAQYHELYPDMPAEAFFPQLAPWFFGFDRVHKALGWTVPADD